jgi:hypothetical protein
MTKLTPQVPAEGISGDKSLNLAHNYHVECSCTDDHHAIDVWIEIDTDDDFSETEVIFYVQDSYPHWNGFFKRVTDAVGILMGKPLTRQHGIMLTRQSALNFTTALNESIKELDTK